MKRYLAVIDLGKCLIGHIAKEIEECGGKIISIMKIMSIIGFEAQSDEVAQEVRCLYGVTDVREEGTVHAINKKR